MKFPKIEQHNLLLDIFESIDGIPKICDQLYFKDTQKIYYRSPGSGPYPENDHTIYSIKFIPGYLYVDYKNDPQNNLRATRYGQEKGYAVNVRDISDLDDYLRKQLRSSYAKSIKRSVNRLETCFDVRYSMYYGDIDKGHYDELMESLLYMIITRFKQRNETSASITNWEQRCKNTYPLILEKRASLFVIYNGQEPISISLNYHFGKIHFSYISSYNIDYSKFGMGHIDIYKQLEWCISNNYSIFEMGWGTLDYKIRWCNLIYNFEHHLVVYKKSLPELLLFPLLGLKIRLKSYLIAKNAHVYLKKIKDKLKSKQDVSQETFYSVEAMGKTADMGNNTIIDYKSKEFDSLRKLVYDFLYTNSLHEKNIKVYKFLHKNSFIIKGGQIVQKIDLNSQNTRS
ncbi:MAG: GNAT family N-acetyltransferase [Flavobacteriaceae bacterium]